MQPSELKIILSADDVPKNWYNILPDLPKPLPPPLDPGTMKPVSPEPLLRIFSKECIMQEVSQERTIAIPDEVREAYIRLGRPTPLHRALRLERALGTPAKIFYKREDMNPVGSHKPNTAIAQAYYAMKQGVQRLSTETGAGQWGSALALASSFFNLGCTVYMTRSSYEQKPYRRILMEALGAKVYPSPSSVTKIGSKFLEADKNHLGSLGIAISEALEDCLTHEDTRYSLGSVLNHVLLHQTVIGQEAKKQLEIAGETPDVLIGCIGGGSNYSGFCYPFMHDKLKGKSEAEFIAAEPKAVPSTTRGVYAYDFADTGMMTPLLKMYTVGHTYQCPPIHAGGLRYHGMAPSICMLIKEGYMRSVAYEQNEVMKAAQTFAQVEGLLPAPETSHAVKAVIDIAVDCKKQNKKKVIAFNFSGHGLLDMKAYEDFMSGRLPSFEATQQMIESGIASIPKVPDV